jgi:outer membrane protein assembly factor BamA
MLRTLLLILLLAPSFTSHADEAHYSVSPSPVIGHDPTYGWLLGGALFVYPNKQLTNNPANRYFDLMAVHIDEPSWMLRSNYRQQGIIGDADLSIEATYSDFNNSWFGDSGDTPSEPLYILQQRSSSLRPELSFSIDTHTRWSIFADHRERSEQAVQDYPNLHLFADQRATAFGAGLQSDNRNDPFSPDQGHSSFLNLSRIGTGQNNIDDAQTVWQLEAQWSQYARLTSDLVWAGRIAAAFSDGEPGYLFRYSLGGAEKLRGLESNRLRGKRYWLLQNELRFPLWHILSGAAFIESGATGETGFDPAVNTAGLGLRFALPPDQRILLRLDFARTQGENTLVYLDFGHAF